MAELDIITLFNPTSEDFTHDFNGEPYTIKAGETTSFAQFAGLHLAKHLSTKMIQDSWSVKDRKDEKKSVRISQSLVYDNPKRRIALYKILKDKNIVQDVLARYSFKGWIGDMKEYEDFVNSQEQAKTKVEVKDQK